MIDNIKGVIIDCETYSQVLLAKHKGRKGCGTHVYGTHPSTKILCLGYLWINDKNKIGGHGVYEPHKEELPPFFKRIHYPRDVIWIAHNAAFEKCILRKWGVQLWGEIWNEINWYCTASHAAYAGVGRSLVDVGARLNIPSPKNIEAGNRLIERLRNVPFTHETFAEIMSDSTFMQELKEYNVSDLFATYEILIELNRIAPWPTEEKKNYQLDQIINDRGFKVDIASIKKLSILGSLYKDKLEKDIQDLTGGRIDRPSRRKEFQTMLEEQGVFLGNFQKKTIKKELQDNNLPPLAKQLLQIKCNSQNTSFEKYENFLLYGKSTGRVRGTYLYYGAWTGRWTAQGVQPQNLKAVRYDNDKKLYTVEKFFKECDALFNTNHFLDYISSLGRLMVIAEDGKILHTVDYSNIEPRLLFCITECQQGIQDLQGDIYLTMASNIFQEEITNKNDNRRHIGKVTILGLGYEMGIPLFLTQLLERGIETNIQFATFIYNIYQRRYPQVPRFWRECQRCAYTTILSGETTYVNTVKFEKTDNHLICTLPSGSTIYYFKPILKDGRIYFWRPKIKNYDSTYGGRLTENIVQRLARDIFVEGMKNLNNAGFSIVLHTHDEVVCEEKEDRLEEMQNILNQTPEWFNKLSGHSLTIPTEGYLSTRYYK